MTKKKKGNQSSGASQQQKPEEQKARRSNRGEDKGDPNLVMLDSTGKAAVAQDRAKAPHFEFGVPPKDAQTKSILKKTEATTNRFQASKRSIQKSQLILPMFQCHPVLKDNRNPVPRKTKMVQVTENRKASYLLRELTHMFRILQP